MHRFVFQSAVRNPQSQYFHLLAFFHQCRADDDDLVACFKAFGYGDEVAISFAELDDAAVCDGLAFALPRSMRCTQAQASRYSGGFICWTSVSCSRRARSSCYARDV